jgi:hypothetical protein
LCPEPENNENETLERLDKDIREFWGLPFEKIDEKEGEAKEKGFDPVEFCENLFFDKHFIDENNRFNVPIPFKINVEMSSNSYNRALKCFGLRVLGWQRTQI